MTTIINNSLIGLELIQRAAYIQLYTNLNEGIEEIEARMADSDEAIAELLGVDYEPTELERVEPENFFEGHKPSLIKAPIDGYPNCAVIAQGATPSDSDLLLDHQSSYSDQLWVEIMVKSIVSEEELNRRVYRSVEAVHIALMRDPTLGGMVPPLQGSPVVVMGEVFTRKERTAYGPTWLWQGARLEYAVRKEAVMPSTSGSIFRSAELGIDQP